MRMCAHVWDGRNESTFLLIVSPSYTYVRLAGLRIPARVVGHSSPVMWCGVDHASRSTKVLAYLSSQRLWRVVCPEG